MKNLLMCASKYGVCSAFCVAATLAASAGRATAEPDAAFPYITQITTSGDGCPEGSVGSSYANDRTSFTLIFDSFIGQTGHGLPAGEADNACTLRLQLAVPKGYTYTLSSFDQRGYVQLPAGASASLSTRVTLNGVDHTVDRAFTGPTSQDYLMQVESPPIRFNAQFCGADTAELIVSSSLQVTSSGTAQLSFDSVAGALVNHAGAVPGGVTLSLQQCPLAAPTLTAQVQPAANEAGWHHGDVSVSFLCDAALGVDDATSSLEPQQFTATGKAEAVCVDFWGSRTQSESEIKIDQEKPTIVVRAPPEAARYLLGERVPTSFQCQDDNSGVLTCEGKSELDTSKLGPFSYRVEATDLAGNQSLKEVTYEVIAAGAGSDAEIPAHDEPDAGEDDAGDIEEDQPAGSLSGDGCSCSVQPAKNGILDEGALWWTGLSALAWTLRRKRRSN